ncbi:MAG: hypothetical protein IJ711_05965 [Lachnospiraceae bacterium]|nr:hypothetical protein [Lachnospiraceae bacterium]
MKAIKTELWKQKKFLFLLCIVFPILINGLLLFDLQYRYASYLMLHKEEYGLSYWQLIFKEQTIFYFSEMFHIVAAVLVYEVFAADLKYNGWMLVASSKYRNRSVLLGKYAVALTGMLLFFVVDYIGLFLVGKQIGVEGSFDGMLFVRSFLVQIFAAGMMLAFYMLLVCLFKRTAYLLPISAVFMLINCSVYYTQDVRLLLRYPFTYISHCFRATTREVAAIAVISLLLGSVFLYLSGAFLRRNRDLSL